MNIKIVTNNAAKNVRSSSSIPSCRSPVVVVAIRFPSQPAEIHHFEFVSLQNVSLLEKGMLACFSMAGKPVVLHMKAH